MKLEEFNKYGDKIRYFNPINDDKFYFAKECAIIVSTHFDDELFVTGSLLLSYSKTIYLFVTHSCDTISDESLWWHQFNMFTECITKINEYRNNRNFEPIFPIVFNVSNFNGMSNEGRRYIHNEIEKLLDEVSIIDYYVTTVKSTHQSHTECNEIALSMMRSPYIEKCNSVLLGTYVQSVYGLSYNTDYKDLNTYVPMTEEQVDLICNLIGKTYNEKNPAGSLLGMDFLKDYFKFYGHCISEDYAQPFITIRHKLKLD